MVSITMDHSAMIFYDRHPVINQLKKLEEEGKLRLFHAQNLNRDLGTLSRTEEKIYDTLRQMVFARPQHDLNLSEHGDLVLLVNHMKTKRDFFITLDKERYANLRGHRSLDIRFPDKKFLREIEGQLGIELEKKAEKKKTAGGRIKKFSGRNEKR